MEGGQNGPSESVDPAWEVIGKITSHLARTAVGPDRKIVPNAQFQIDVRDPDNREKILENLIMEVCPSGVNPDAWKAWLAGGRSPFISPLNKAGQKSENPAQTLLRKTRSVASHEKKVNAARAEFEARQGKLAEAERDLEYAKAYENAALHWHVVDQLTEIMAPAFAMGPAWTIMRSISAHASDAAADKATSFLFFDDEKAEGIMEYRASRANETEKMFGSLDWFAGYEPFEEALRSAVMKVCKNFEPRRAEAGSDGRRERTSAKMKTEAHPKAVYDADEVLAGLAREATDQS